MKTKKKRRKPVPKDPGLEIISLRDRQALLLANDRMNEEYGDGYVAYLDVRRGMKLYRRIIAHGTDLRAVNDAVDLLPRKDQDRVTLHYAMKPRDYIEVPPGRM